MVRDLSDDAALLKDLAAEGQAKALRQHSLGHTPHEGHLIGV